MLCPGPVATRIGVAERNRPAREHEEHRPPPARRGAAGETVPEIEFMDPADVAAQVVEAVRDERFYILTHEILADGGQYDAAIRARMEGILARRNPARPDAQERAD